MIRNKEPKEATEGWNQQMFNNFCGQKIEWIFNPPSASHMGGTLIICYIYIPSPTYHQKCLNNDDEMTSAVDVLGCKTSIWLINFVPSQIDERVPGHTVRKGRNGTH